MLSPLPGKGDKNIIASNSTPHKQIENQTQEHPADQIGLGEVDKTFTLHDLMNYLINNKEINLYYYLLNEISVISFSPELIEISPIMNNKEYNNKLSEIISNLLGQKIVLNIRDKKDAISLKSKLISDLYLSKPWAELNNILPGCEILDIIHKNG